VVALATLVVVPQHTVASYDIGKAILEAMPGWRNRVRDVPYYQIDEGIRGNNHPSPEQRPRNHADGA